MKIEDFVAAFPGHPFALRWVERGPHGERKFGWHAMFTSDYFTSDTDRLIDNHQPPHHWEAFADTPEAALGQLAKLTLDSAKSNLLRASQRHDEARQHLDGLLAAVEGKPL